MRTRFDKELDHLHEAMEEIGQLCKESISESTDALFTGNYHKAEDTINLHHRIHKAERDIEENCLRLLMEQQPVATDLRIISASLKAVYDLERIGEIGADIVELILKEHLSDANDMLNLKSMSQIATCMVNDAVTALANQNVELAKAVIDRDDQVDYDFGKAKAFLIDNFNKDSNPEYLINLMMVAKYFEKIGDHAVNIAKWSLFVTTGKTGR
ncbi:phosphate signaling complex protein PhoU [Lactobacillus crispatus]|uniref:phosphate signaling complex protein PhoU n=1 Tax=Lactobacillus crispatus TaxID=47770 RepID=UPI0018E34B90|nr:phosphate signaling complex protein PhoU [Lactobacillus crispatus]MBI1713046.1 PhoU family transcriptional regulator [Lactobacillus crispatus]QPP18314.1 PhoU family transcriptional regulator [Lactobacillus crispatus]